MNVDTSNWSGEGTFTQTMIDRLSEMDTIESLRVEDAPATRSEADYNFISNEIFVSFATRSREERIRRWVVVPTVRLVHEKVMTIPGLEERLTTVAGIGAPDYSDGDMLQYLRTERIIPPYQTRGYKLVELLRIYEAGNRADD